MRIPQETPIAEGYTLNHYRQVIFYWFAISASVSIAPFAVLAYINGHPLLGAVLFCLVLVFIVDAAFMHWNRKPPVPPIAVSVLIIVSLSSAISGGGVKGVVWGYPALMLFQFLLNRWAANLVSIVMVIVISAFSYSYLGGSVTLRVTVSLLLTLTFTNIFMSYMLELQRVLEQHAIIDPLTGVYNRRRFDSNLEHAIALRSSSDKPSSLLLIDVDHFKAINDELGHAAGDLVLRDLAAIIRDAMRQSDSLFRLGGEEFAVLMTNADLELAAKVAERIRAAVSNANLLNYRPITISIGFDEFNLCEDRVNLLDRCDAALYRAKELGRNRVESCKTLQPQSA